MNDLCMALGTTGGLLPQLPNGRAHLLSEHMALLPLHAHVLRFPFLFSEGHSKEVICSGWRCRAAKNPNEDHLPYPRQPIYSFCNINNHKKKLKFRAIVNRFTYGLAAKKEIGSERPNVRSTCELAGGGDAALKPVVDRQGPASASFLAYPVDRPSPAMASVAAPCSPEI
ncbi:hypothetical protein TIFTF001_025154 [Ficus carica]|uniref:Uncharacterized protein n=1 Tax=Ficus carica TaxID=3494 RepID=A0AA88DH60_FICCA|nr:hypothetical protein TIFTF001_025154 [Ficus carica]